MQEKKQATDVIRILQKHFNVYTDGDLADRIGSTRSAISQWKVYDRIPKKILTKYHDLISGDDEEIVVEAETIHITKGEEKVDANYIIGLQKEKIEYQNEEINRLNAIVQKQSKKIKNKPAFHFKTKCTYDCENKSFGKNKVTGDTSMTGYTPQFLSDLNNEEWFAMFHPESANQLVSSIPAEVPDHTHNKFKNLLWKAKDGTYKVYNMESYYDKKEGIVRAYYYWVNGDVEGLS